MGIAGLASKEGTTRFMERFPVALEKASYRRFRKMRPSSVGIGTYLGQPTAEDDAAYTASLARALALGCNVIDTAIVYRHMRSERVVGKVIQDAIAAQKIARDEILVCTKGGYFSYDADSGIPAEQYFQKHFISSGLASETDVALQHSLRPEFIKHQLNQSLTNLGLDSVDIYYLHNPETQLERVGRAAFLEQLAAAFTVLEEAASAGKIGCYGLATWAGFRVADDNPSYLSVEEVVKVAQKVGGENHHFGAIQLPLNLSKTEGVALNKQTVKGKTSKVSVTAAAAEHRIGIFASATLDQGKLTKFIPPLVKQHFRKLENDTQVAVQFARSCTGVVSALVGMKTLSHVDEALGIFNANPESPENFIRLFESPDRSLVTNR